MTDAADLQTSKMLAAEVVRQQPDNAEARTILRDVTEEMKRRGIRDHKPKAHNPGRAR